VRWVGATGLGPPGRRLCGNSIDFRLLTSGVYTISFPPLSPRRRYKVLYTLRVHHPFPPTTTAHRPFAEIFHPQWLARQWSWCKWCGVGRVRLNISHSLAAATHGRFRSKHNKFGAVLKFIH